jgi:hypothetical protein
MLQQKTGTRASDLIGGVEYTAELAGLGHDEWACFQFDSAVTWLGVYIENKLNKLDKKGKPIYTLEQLLTPKPASITELADRHPGLVKVYDFRKRGT